jgi:nitrite reductase/ring-hydroxylating ferredoxin subunit
MALKRIRRARAGSRKRGSSRPARYRIARVAEVAPGCSLKFILPLGGVDEECFVVNFGGAFYAYVNRCCHVPIAMDWIDNQFFTADGGYLLCQTHNACYAPDSGECLAGPPGIPGKSLTRIALEVSDGIIYGRPPAAAIKS